VTMLQQTVTPADRASVQFTLDFIFGDNPLQKISALANYLNRIRKSCEEGLGEGDLCSLLPPGVCRDGFCLSICAANPGACVLTGGLIGDTVRRVVQSVQADRCEGQGGDPDEDNVCTAQDNCDPIANQDQTDSDADGMGDACKCSGLTRQDQDADGIEDCVDACLLPTSVFGPFVPNIAAPMCGCQPVALVGRGQLRTWNGGAGNTGVPHLDALRCNFSADSAPTDGPFLLRDVTRQAVNAALPGHLHGGALSSSSALLGPGFLSGFSAVLSQEMVTKVKSGSGPAEIVSKNTMTEYSQPPTQLDRGAVDAQVGSQLFYDFLRTITGPSGAPLVSLQDPAPGPLASMVSHVNEELIESNDLPDLDIFAFFAFDGPNSFVGYPLLEGNIYGSAALDIVGHEWFHAFLKLASSPRGLGVGLSTTRVDTKSQIVEEAFCDAVGVSFEHTFATRGRVPGKTPNFVVGEDVNFENGNLTLANPRQNNRPDHVLSRLFQDNCQPDGSPFPPSVVSRICEGPFLKAYHLLAVGGTFPTTTDRNAGGGYTAPTVAVTGVGVPTAARIAFQAARNRWMPDLNYTHYVLGMILAARELGTPSAQVQSVINAYDAVGLLPGRIATIPASIVPAGAGTVTIESPIPGLILQGDLLTVTARPATGRTFAGFVVRFANGTTRDRGPGNPLQELAQPGLTIEARFN
jgi:hypothetical protein